MKTLIRAVEILATEDIKEGDRVYLDVKKAKLIPQQMSILKKMLKNGGDGKLLVVRLHENTGKAEVAGWKGDAILGTLQVPIDCLSKDRKQTGGVSASIDSKTASSWSRFEQLKELVGNDGQLLDDLARALGDTLLNDHVNWIIRFYELEKEFGMDDEEETEEDLD